MPVGEELRAGGIRGQKDRWREFGRLTGRLLAVLQGRQRGRRSESEVTEGRQSETPSRIREQALLLGRTGLTVGVSAYSPGRAVSQGRNEFLPSQDHQKQGADEPVLQPSPRHPVECPSGPPHTWPVKSLHVYT